MPGGDPNPPGDTETAALRKLVGAGKGVSGDKLIAAAWDAIRTIDEGN